MYVLRMSAEKSLLQFHRRITLTGLVFARTIAPSFHTLQLFLQQSLSQFRFRLRWRVSNLNTVSSQYHEQVADAVEGPKAEKGGISRQVENVVLLIPRGHYPPLSCDHRYLVFSSARVVFRGSCHHAFGQVTVRLPFSCQTNQLPCLCFSQLLEK